MLTKMKTKIKNKRLSKIQMCIFFFFVECIMIFMGIIIGIEIAGALERGTFIKNFIEVVIMFSGMTTGACIIYLASPRVRNAYAEFNKPFKK